MKWTHVSNPFETLNGTRGIADLCIVVAIVCTRRSRSCWPVDFWIEWEKECWHSDRFQVVWFSRAWSRFWLAAVWLSDLSVSDPGVIHQGETNSKELEQLGKRDTNTHTNAAVTGLIMQWWTCIIYTNSSTLCTYHRVPFAGLFMSENGLSRARELVWRGSTFPIKPKLVRLVFLFFICYFYFFVVLFKRQIHVRTTNHFIRLCLSRLAHINACAALKPVEHFGGQHFD